MAGRSAAGKDELDSIDFMIMARLQEDGRCSNASISRAVGVSQSTVKKRIDRLVKLGIMRVLAVVDPIASGHGQHMMVGINVKPGTATAVGDALAAMPEVAFVRTWSVATTSGQRSLPRTLTVSWHSGPSGYPALATF